MIISISSLFQQIPKFKIFLSSHWFVDFSRNNGNPPANSITSGSYPSNYTVNDGATSSNMYKTNANTQPYPQAIPVLVNLVESDLIKDEKLREGIFRALTVKEAREKIGKFLIDQYNKTTKEKKILRWVIGNTMSKTVTEKDFESISEIVSNKENGMSRQMFVIALGQLKSPKAEELLIELLDDSEVAAFALDALGRMKSVKAKSKIEKLLDDSNLLIKREAQKALKKIT